MEPWKKNHRKMVDMFLNDTAAEMAVQQAVKEHVRSVEAEESAHEYFMEMFVFGIINPANERLDEEEESLNLHSEDGDYKVRVERRNIRGFKDIVMEAKALLQEVIDETLDEDSSSVPVGMIKLVKSLLFGRTNRTQFKFTDTLKDFMQMDPEELGDERLIKAQEIVKKAYKVEKGRWYRTVFRYDESEQRYVSIRPEYEIPEGDNE